MRCCYLVNVQSVFAGCQRTPIMYIWRVSVFSLYSKMLFTNSDHHTVGVGRLFPDSIPSQYFGADSMFCDFFKHYDSILRFIGIFERDMMLFLLYFYILQFLFVLFSQCFISMCIIQIYLFRYMFIV